jgi:4-amino-4-deoxy-L-arabinose transferase-like glycosyltransferase
MLFLKRYYATIILGLALAFIFVISFDSLLTKPKLWSDEALSIELARNFLHWQNLNIQVSPNVFYDFPYLIQSTGYPVTVPLAGIFELFGQGLYQARLYMLAWMIVSVITLFVLGQRLFDKKQALAAVILTITFASFYGSGRTVVGEIPGFTFLLLGLYFWIKRRNYYLMGFLWGFAIVSKPSVFGLLIPTISFALILNSDSFLEKIKQIGTIAIGMLPAGILGIFFVISSPFSREPWSGIIDFFKNPYSSASINSNVTHNLLATFESTTFIYFGFLFAVIVVARFFQRQGALIFIYNLVIIYSILAFLYYLRSPGWIRYILISELLILFILPNSIQTVVSRLKWSDFISSFRKDVVSYGVLVLLISIQTFQLFTGAQLYKSSSALETARFINEQYSGFSVASFHSLEVSVLLETEKRFNTANFIGVPFIGDDLKPIEDSPEIVVLNLNYPFISRTLEVMKNHYHKSQQIGNYAIYFRS